MIKQETLCQAAQRHAARRNTPTGGTPGTSAQSPNSVRVPAHPCTQDKHGHWWSAVGGQALP
eukprot:13765743-Alexandrium_andersonii.AAC.1